MCPRLPYSVKYYNNIIILLHGFNSGPGKKAEEIRAFLEEKNLKDDYQLIAPKLNIQPRRAIREINKIIRQNEPRNIYLIGTSLGGCYANYFRAKFKESFLEVHSINPSWRPSKTLSKYVDKNLENFKTKEKWEFKEDYQLQLADIEFFIDENLDNNLENKYFVHLSKSDEILKFEEMIDFFKRKNIVFTKREYDSDHRFGNIRDVLDLIIK